MNQAKPTTTNTGDTKRMAQVVSEGSSVSHAARATISPPIITMHKIPLMNSRIWIPDIPDGACRLRPDLLPIQRLVLVDARQIAGHGFGVLLGGAGVKDDDP